MKHAGRDRVAVNISWAQPDIFHNMVLSLGGMHFLMCFIGCVGSLMAESGLVDILSCAFRGVIMLTWKQEISTECPCIEIIIL